MQGFKGRTDEGKRLFVLYGKVIETSVINARLERFVFDTKKKPSPTVEDDVWVIPVASNSRMYFSVASLLGLEHCGCHL